MAEFIKQATREVDGLIKSDGTWYHTLPYSGALSQDKARELEIERSAIWQRVIYDAGRSQLSGLKWDCRMDDLACDDCRARHGQIIGREEFGELAASPRHLGCRCELIPVRD